MNVNKNEMRLNVFFFFLVSPNDVRQKNLFQILSREESDEIDPHCSNDT